MMTRPALAFLVSWLNFWCVLLLFFGIKLVKSTPVQWNLSAKLFRSSQLSKAFHIFCTIFFFCFVWDVCAFTATTASSIYSCAPVFILLHHGRAFLLVSQFENQFARRLILAGGKRNVRWNQSAANPHPAIDTTTTIQLFIFKARLSSLFHLCHTEHRWSLGRWWWMKHFNWPVLCLLLKSKQPSFN